MARLGVGALSCAVACLRSYDGTMKATLRCKVVCQDEQVVDAGVGHLRAKVIFDLVVGGKAYRNLSVVVAQPMDTDYRVAPLTVAPLSRDQYDGPMNVEAFTEAIERYYRRGIESLVGPNVSKIRNLEMLSNVVIREESTEFEVEESRSVGW